MPRADRESRNEYQREHFKKRYETEPEFREKESKRKAAWYAKNPEENRRKVREQVANFRERKRAAKKALEEQSAVSELVEAA